jgi:DNA-binding CsgD family transcriptional regulator
MTSRKENDLVEALYDAALGHLSWDEVGQRVVGYMGSTTLMLSVHQARSPAVDVVATFGMSPQILQEYGYFAQHDLWALGALQKRLFGQAVTGPQVVEERTLMRSLIYNEYLRPKVNVHHIAGAILPMDGGHHAVVGAHRPRDAKDFATVEVGRLTRLLPHLQRALEVRRRLQHAEQAGRSVFSALDQLSLGVIIMTATGRLLHVNAAADAILRSGDGLARTPDGLRAGSKDDDKRLQALIGALRQRPGEAQSTGGHLRVRRPSGKQAYAVMLAPVGPGVVAGANASPTILMFVSDPGEKILSDLSVLEELFGFPPAEARLVLALLSGVTVPEFARKTGVTYNTARTLLARAMARTDSRSQVELVLLVAGSVSGTLAVGGGRERPT